MSQPEFRAEGLFEAFDPKTIAAVDTPSDWSEFAEASLRVSLTPVRVFERASGRTDAVGHTTQVDRVVCRAADELLLEASTFGVERLHGHERQRRLVDGEVLRDRSTYRSCESFAGRRRNHRRSRQRRVGVARRLGVEGTEVYELIASGELAAGKGKDGLVYVRGSALDDYKRRHPAVTG